MQIQKSYQQLPDMEYLQGDTLPVFHISVDNLADFKECTLILASCINPNLSVLEKICSQDATGFFVQLTNEDTKSLSGLYQYHFKITDNSGLQYRKIIGMLSINPVAQR